MQTSADKPQGRTACFSLVPSVIFRISRPVPIEVFRKGKVDAVLCDIGLPFKVVPLVFHGLIVHTINKGIKTEGAPPGLLKERLTALLPLVRPRKNEVMRQLS
jgi:hypothetical protein